MGNDMYSCGLEKSEYLSGGVITSHSMHRNGGGLDFYLQTTRLCSGYRLSILVLWIYQIRDVD
jgi:hypothetical protein